MAVVTNRPSSGLLLLAVQRDEPRVGSVVPLQLLPAVQPLDPLGDLVVPEEVLFVAPVVPRVLFPLAWMP